jgi:hypothetical protein
VAIGEEFCCPDLSVFVVNARGNIRFHREAQARDLGEKILASLPVDSPLRELTDPGLTRWLGGTLWILDCVESLLPVYRLCYAEIGVGDSGAGAQVLQEHGVGHLHDAHRFPPGGEKFFQGRCYVKERQVPAWIDSDAVVRRPFNFHSYYLADLKDPVILGVFRATTGRFSIYVPRWGVSVPRTYLYLVAPPRSVDPQDVRRWSEALWWFEDDMWRYDGQIRINLRYRSPRRWHLGYRQVLQEVDLIMEWTLEGQVITCRRSRRQEVIEALARYAEQRYSFGVLFQWREPPERCPKILENAEHLNAEWSDEQLEHLRWMYLLPLRGELYYVQGPQAHQSPRHGQNVCFCGHV